VAEEVGFVVQAAVNGAAIRDLPEPAALLLAELAVHVPVPFHAVDRPIEGAGAAG
jgi:hypothetical protein